MADAWSGEIEQQREVKSRQEEGGEMFYGRYLEKTFFKIFLQQKKGGHGIHPGPGQAKNATFSIICKFEPQKMSETVEEEGEDPSSKDYLSRTASSSAR